MKATLRFPAFELPHCIVIGQPTRLLDVHTPSPLLLLSPAFRYEEHTVEFELVPAESHRPWGWRDFARDRGRRAFPDSAIIFDARHDAQRNLAHVFQNQIGILLAGLDSFGLTHRFADVEVIVQPKASRFVIDSIRALGFENIHATAEVVVGQRLRMRPRKFPLRAVAGRYLRRQAIEVGMLSDRDVASDPIFIKRKRRTATNLDEVARIARSAGYEDVFLETLPMEEQIRRVATAERIFAFHGAALGHLYFRDPSWRGCVVEAFSSGFATNWARANATMMGDAWIGLQGELEAKAIRGLARGVHHHTFEGMDFHLDESTVRMSLELAEQEAGDLRHAVASLRAQGISTITVDPDRRGAD